MHYSHTFSTEQVGHCPETTLHLCLPYVEFIILLLGGFNKNRGFLLGGSLTCEELVGGFLLGGNL